MKAKSVTIRYSAAKFLVDFREGNTLKTRVDLRGANEATHKYVGFAVCEHVKIVDKRLAA